MEGQKKIRMSVQGWFITICTGIIIAIIIFLNFFTLSGNYKRQVVNILNEYKNGELTGQETIEKIDTIVEKIEKDNNNKKSDSLSRLNIYVNSILYGLRDGEMGNAEVDAKIKEIKRLH